jgi:hypothetical protein
MALKPSPFIVRVEEIPETGISFGLTMNDIRTWLDHHQIQPVEFKTIPRSFGGMGFQITFANHHDAQHFGTSNAERYRLEADRIRREAELSASKTTHDQLMNIALQFERLADSIDPLKRGEYQAVGR